MSDERRCGRAEALYRKATSYGWDVEISYFDAPMIYVHSDGSTQHVDERRVTVIGARSPEGFGVVWSLSWFTNRWRMLEAGTWVDDDGEWSVSLAYINEHLP